MFSYSVFKFVQISICKFSSPDNLNSKNLKKCSRSSFDVPFTRTLDPNFFGPSFLWPMFFHLFGMTPAKRPWLWFGFYLACQLGLNVVVLLPEGGVDSWKYWNYVHKKSTFSDFFASASVATRFFTYLAWVLVRVPFYIALHSWLSSSTTSKNENGRAQKAWLDAFFSTSKRMFCIVCEKFALISYAVILTHNYVVTDYLVEMTWRKPELPHTFCTWFSHVSYNLSVQIIFGAVAWALIEGPWFSLLMTMWTGLKKDFIFKNIFG